MQTIQLIAENLKQYSFLQNTAYDYTVAFLILLGLIIILKIFQLIVLRRLRKVAEKTQTDFDDVLIEIFEHLKPPFYFIVAFYFSLQYLTLTESADKIVNVIFIVVMVYEVIKAAERLVNYFAKKYIAKSQGSEKNSQSMIRALTIVVKLGLWVLGIAFILSNLGINITSLVASLGIGGIAVALALQNVLSDIFSSFSIYVDKPFVVGDFIVVGQDKGIVERIGMKTTRIRTLQGEELVISNKELTTARVQNFKKLKKRRIVFTIGVIYGTPDKKLEMVPKIVKEVISKIKIVQFDRCHFAEFADSSLVFEVVYFIDSSDYMVHMDTKQKILSEIYSRFNKAKIEFAYPTQTIHVQKG